MFLSDILSDFAFPIAVADFIWATVGRLEAAGFDVQRRVVRR